MILHSNEQINELNWIIYQSFCNYCIRSKPFLHFIVIRLTKRQMAHWKC